MPMTKYGYFDPERFKKEFLVDKDWRRKIWNTAYNILPQAPYMGPPLPTGLSIDWPNSVRKYFPNWLFKTSNKIQKAKNNLLVKLIPK